jgi:CRISPR-associated endonuclease Csn1
MPISAGSSQKYTLGLDLGSASLGWALVALDDEDEPIGLLRTGVRIFEPGVDGTTMEIEQGKDQSKAVDRRTERLHRRQLRRRAARQRELFHLLQAHSLLPPFEGLSNQSENEKFTSSGARHAILNAFDQQLQTKWDNANSDRAAMYAQLPLYFLRAAGLDEKLEPYEFGRVLYHLIQRRGFKSNRRETAKNVEKDKELGAVKAGISQLEQEMKAANARTLGEYFSTLDPHQQKVRRLWTARAMYEHEFNLLWQTQATHHPELLTAEFRAQIATLLFFQRRIAAQGHLIGKCELEPDKRRAPWASLEAQRFRILQKVNDLKLIEPGNPDAQPLTPEERASVYTLLDQEGDQTFAAIRKHLGMPKTIQFNLERGDEKKLRGNRTNVTMTQVFGDRWALFSEEDQKRIVEEWRTSESEDSLMRRGIEHWGLSEASAKLWAEKHPEDGYCALSRKAISRLMPLMISGMSFKEAETKLYGDRFSGNEVFDAVPVVRESLKTLRNPAVERSLTELRKVVNAIIREYGKPYEIRIELARDLKKPRQERVTATKNNRKRQSEREAVKAKILKECGLEYPSRADIEKAMLHEECGGICPYTGRAIPFSGLFRDSQFDVEHIIPISRYPDDSFQNKTLCYHEENRNRKRNRTPFEAYPANDWKIMLERVKKFNNPGKLKRFMLRTEDELKEFSSRQMNDTRYASVLAGRLLGTLYGGRDVATGTGARQAIFASSGFVTATLRRAWGLESILREAVPSTNGQNKGKPRTDHRHHAIDAITIALTKQSVIHAMSSAASADINPQHSARSFRSLPAPWVDFVASIRPQIENMVVSHRPEHKISGELHDATNYGQPYTLNGKPTVHIRKPVEGLSAKDIENIVDDEVRRAVAQKAESLAGDLSKCATSNDWPFIQAKDGRHIPIKRARIKKVLKVTPIASGPRERFVAESSNHHVAIFAQMDATGREKRWDSIPVSLLEATERKRRKLPIIQKSYPDEKNFVFKFSLMGGDMIEIHRNCNHAENACVPSIYRVRTIATNGQLSLVRVNDARMILDIKEAKEWWSPRANTLKQMECRKVVIDLMGRIHPAND